ncbi:MAG: hydrogenase maturation protease [Chloroflexota bacterium]
MKILVAGLGNPILGDDGAGWQVVKLVKKKLGTEKPFVTFDMFDLAGLSLMEQMIGYEKAIIVDSMNTGSYPAGTVITCTLDELDKPGIQNFSSAHDISLAGALTLGRDLGKQLPADQNIMIVGIETEKVFDFSEQLSTVVNASIEPAAAEVIELLFSTGESET